MMRLTVPSSSKPARLEKVTRTKEPLPDSLDSDAQYDVPLLPSNIKSIDSRGNMSTCTIAIPRAPVHSSIETEEQTKTKKRRAESPPINTIETVPLVTQDSTHITLPIDVPHSAKPVEPIRVSPPLKQTQIKHSSKKQRDVPLVIRESSDPLFLHNMRGEYIRSAAEREQLKLKLSESREREDMLTSDKEKMKTLAATAETRVSDLERENKELRSKIARLEHLLGKMADEAVQTQLRTAQDHFLVAENDHLRRDNQKLFAMLKETVEYQKLASFADSESPIRLLHTPHTSNDSLPRIKECKEVPKDLLWAPEKTFQFLRALNQCEGFHLPESSVELIVHQLNRVWRQRELYILDKCHAYCKNCNNKLLRRPYELPSRPAATTAIDIRQLGRK